MKKILLLIVITTTFYLFLSFEKTPIVYAADCAIETALVCCGCNSIKQVERSCCTNQTPTCTPWYDITVCEPNMSLCSEFCGGGTTCTDGQTGPCGSNGCNSGQTSICIGGAWQCVNDATCGSAGCEWVGIPSGCVQEGDTLPKWPPGTCAGATAKAGQDCRYDSDCSDGVCKFPPFGSDCYCNIPAQNQCCTGLVVNHPISYACVCSTTEPCTPTTPQKPTLVNPPDNSIHMDNSVLIDWSNISNWGKGCPQANSYRARYIEKTGANCPTTTAFVNTPTGLTSQYNLRDLKWDTTYCWFGSAHNGSIGARSDATWQFTTAKTPTFEDIDITTAGTCGNSISGNSAITGTDNPITIMTEFSLDDNGIGAEEIDEVAIAIVPTEVRAAPTVSEESLASVTDKYVMGLARINYASPSQSTFAIVNTNTFPFYSSFTSTGNKTNTSQTATLLNINGSQNSNTHVEVINETTVRVYWQIRFDNNYIYKLDGSTYQQVIDSNIYTAAFREVSPGHWNSSTGSATIDRALGLEGTWGINVQIPKITIGQPISLPSNRFSVNWNVTGNQLTTADGYMWTSTSPIAIQRVTPSTLNINLTTSEPADFSNSNIGVGIGASKSLGNHVYAYTSLADNSINTKMSANDTACNKVTDTGTSMGNADAWFISANGNAYADNFQNETLQGQFDGALDIFNDLSYLSTYLAYIKESTLSTNNRESKYNMIGENYDDWNGVPPKSSSFSDWYSYLYDLAQANTTIENAPAGDKTIPAGTNTQTFLVNQLGGSIGKGNVIVTRHAHIQGNLTIANNTQCNTRSVFFIEGNLSISPNFEVVDQTVLMGPISMINKMGCVFIVRGNIDFQAGDNHALYDRVDGYFISNGSINILVDNDWQTTGTKPDNMYIKGGLIANTIDLSRDLGTYNTTQAAEIIEYDPRYIILFEEMFKIQEFKIREKNYVNKK